MKHFPKLFFLACLLISQVLFGQNISPEPPHSTYGRLHTPRGDLHMLVILIRYPDKSLINNPKWPDSSEPGELPRMFVGENNEMFCESPDSLGLRRYDNLSDYLYVMSGGKFRVTAEVYPQQVPVTYIPETSRNWSRRQQTMNEEAVRWITENDPDFDWARFDQRTNSPNYRSDNSNSEPDGKLDYVLFLHRDHGANGFSSAPNLTIPGTDLRIADGQTGNKNYVDAKHNRLIFLHELVHNLYNAPHYVGANHADGNRYYTQKGWGLMAPWITPFSTPLAWESWWLGWLEPQTITEAGTYILRDFVSEQDAIRIPIPGSDQHLWLENHQKVDQWDEKLFYSQEDSPFTATAPGLYAYVVAEPGADRSDPSLNPFDKSDVNFIRMYNGQGNWDYRIAEATPHHRRGRRFPTFERVAINPIMGQNDFQFIRWDYDNNGRIDISNRHGNNDGRPQEDKEIWNELIDGVPVHTGNTTGDEHDALGVGDELGLSGLFPVFNYPVYRRKEQRLTPIELNGLHIEVVGQRPDGSFELEVRFDDWELREDQRWCGPIHLSDATGDQPLTVAEDVSLTLDLGGTPDRMTRDSLTGTFTNPTEFMISDQRSLHLKRRANLTLQAHSQLILTDSAQLILEPGATLRLEPGTMLRLADQSQLQISPFARVIVEEGAQFITEDREQVSHWRRVRE